jgi:DNA-binding MarR family transcriptional regulator
MVPASARRSPPAPGDLELSDADGLAQVSFVVLGTLGRRASEHGLSVIQMRLLGVLRDRTPSMNELAKLLELDKSSVTGLVDRAERRGLVARIPSIADRRSLRVALTDSGRSLAAHATGGFDGDVEELLSGLSPAQRRTLGRLLSRVVSDYASRRGLDLSAGTRMSSR